MNDDLDECLSKGSRNVTHYTKDKNGNKPNCETCPGTEEYAKEMHLLTCYSPRKEYLKLNNISKS